METESGDLRCPSSSSDVTFLGKSKGLVKNHSYFKQAVCTLLWLDCFETCMIVTPRHKKTRKLQF